MGTCSAHAKIPVSWSPYVEANVAYLILVRNYTCFGIKSIQESTILAFFIFMFLFTRKPNILSTPMVIITIGGLRYLPMNLYVALYFNGSSQKTVYHMLSIVGLVKMNIC